MRPIKVFSAERGDMEDFLKGEKKRFEDINNECQQMLKPDMKPLSKASISKLERALQNPEDIVLLMIPFEAFKINASYSIISEDSVYRVEVYATQTDFRVAEAMRCLLEKYGFEVRDYNKK